jgi:hypothetical protein
LFSVWNPAICFAFSPRSVLCNPKSRILWNRNKFFYFKGLTALGEKQAIIGWSISGSDYTPMHEFYDT